MLHLVDLDDETRGFMLEEVDADVAAGTIYLSRRLSSRGRDAYPGLLRRACEDGDDQSLAIDLAAPGLFDEYETAVRNGSPYRKRVPRGANVTLAEGEFNRFYLRGLARAVIALGGTEVEVYRARASSDPRGSSEAMIGQRVDAYSLLADLRANTGVDTALGLPPGPNSGLSARHPQD